MQVVLITGCSNGLGLALAKTLKATGKFRLVITARKSSLLKLKKTFPENDNLIVRELDLHRPDNFKHLIKEISYLWGGVDILINNAAIVYRAVLEHVSLEEEQTILQTNYLGPRELTRLVIPYMRHKKRGQIINISSVSGMMAMPTMSSYSAAKWALEGSSEALWYELKPFNIKVSLVQLGFVHSDSFKNTLLPQAAKTNHQNLYKIYYTAMEDFIEQMMKLSKSTPEKISRLVLNEVILKKSPPLRISGTWDARFFSLLRWILPARIYHLLLYYFLPSSIRITIKNLMKLMD